MMVLKREQSGETLQTQELKARLDRTEAILKRILTQRDQLVRALELAARRKPRPVQPMARPEARPRPQQLPSSLRYLEEIAG